jgi:hypothetical protein
MQFSRLRRREFIALLGTRKSVSLCMRDAAQQVFSRQRQTFLFFVLLASWSPLSACSRQPSLITGGFSENQFSLLLQFSQSSPLPSNGDEESKRADWASSHF